MAREEKEAKRLKKIADLEKMGYFENPEELVMTSQSDESEGAAT